MLAPSRREGHPSPGELTSQSRWFPAQAALRSGLLHTEGESPTLLLWGWLDRSEARAGRVEQAPHGLGRDVQQLSVFLLLLRPGSFVRRCTPHRLRETSVRDGPHPSGPWCLHGLSMPVGLGGGAVRPSRGPENEDGPPAQNIPESSGARRRGPSAC